jgi:hypothetical protein
MVVSDTCAKRRGPPVVATREFELAHRADAKRHRTRREKSPETDVNHPERLTGLLIHSANLVVDPESRRLAAVGRALHASKTSNLSA